MEGLVDIRRIFDCVSEIWILLDRHGKVLLTSTDLGRFQQMINPPLVEGCSLIDSLPDTWKMLAANVLSTLPTSRVPSILEASFTEQDQKETHFEIKCTGIPDESGELVQIFVKARDVTPQKIFERKITIVAREYQNLIENANAVIIGTDARGYVTEWNEMAHQVTGYSRNECYIRQFSEFLADESQPAYREAMDRVLNNQVITNYEMALRSRHGERLTMLINATPRTSASGEVVGILFIGQDITELWAYRKSLEEKVRERTQALKSALESEKKLVEVKDRFVSMASHEFRSPISYIHRNIGTLRDNIESLSPEDVRQRLKKIQSQAEHLTSLLEDVLTIGKTGASNTRIKANLRHVDLKDFFLRIIDEVQTNTQNTHRIHFSCAHDSLTILSDENLLRNIFVNLLTNAIKFSPGRHTVNLTVTDFDRYVQCSIQDYGLGIGEEDLPRIFDPFHRGGNVTAIKGTGLGLPIVKRAVETLGGTVSVESKAGTGSLFVVKLNQHHS